MGQQIRKLLARGAAVASIALASLFGFGSPAQAGEGFWSSNNTCTGSSSVTFTPGNSVTAYLCTNFAIINYACDFGIKLRAADAATDAAQFAVTNRALPAAIVAPANSVTYPEAVVAAPIPTSNYDWGGYFSTSIPPVGYDVGGQSSFLLATFTFSTKSTSTSGPDKIELDSAYPSYISIAPAASGSSGCGNAEIGNNFDTPIPQLTLTPAAPPPVISTTSLPAGTVGTAYSQPLAASNSPTNWVVSTGTLPAGLTLAAATGVISGTPTAPGTSNFSVTASNGTVSAPKALSITINAMPKPVVNPSPNGSSAPNLLSEARTSVAYSFTLQASNSPTAWSFIGATPAWLSLSNTGVLSGTPPAGSSGMLSVTVTATNAGGTSDQVKFSIPITVVGEPIITTPAGALPGGQRLSELSLEERMAYYKQKYDRSGAGEKQREPGSHAHKPAGPDKTGGRGRKRGAKTYGKGREKEQGKAGDKAASPEAGAASAAPGSAAEAPKKGFLSGILGLFKKKKTP
jgi:hypothetical protein